MVELYARVGWAGLTFDDVANHAKVGKAALYLRWSSKEDLLLDCMADLNAQRSSPSHGELRADLTSIVHALFDFFTSTGGLAYLRLYVECRYVPGLEERWRKQQATPMFLETRALVHEAAARGELPEDTSPTILLDALIGAIINHVLSTPPELFKQMQDSSAGYIDALIDFALAGAGAAAG